MDQKHKSNLIITCLCLIIVFVSLLTMYDNFSFHTYNTKTYYDYFLSLNHQGFTLQDYELYKDQSNYHCGDGTLVLGKIDSLVDGQDIDVIIQINRKQHIDYSLKYLEGGSYSLENKEDLKNRNLNDIEERVNSKGLKNLVKELEIGELTLKDIIKELQKPGRDPREDMPKPVLRADVLKFEDLKEGMILTGTVRNVTDFGAFVDVGVKHDGLVHISQLSNSFVKNPSDVVSVGDVVKVKIIGIDEDRKKAQLSMKI